jgi:chromosome segregation ATPase
MRLSQKVRTILLCAVLGIASSAFAYSGSVYDAQRALDDAKAQVDAACSAAATARSNVDSAQSNYDAAVQNLQNAYNAIDEGQKRIAALSPDIERATADLTSVSTALMARGKARDEATSRADAASASIESIRKDAEAEFHASPAWQQTAAAIESAQDDLDEVNDLVLFPLNDDFSYQQLVKQADQRRVEVDQLRQQAGVDPKTIEEASKRWMDAENAVHALEDATLDANEYVHNARLAVAQARNDQNDLVKRFEGDFAADPNLAEAAKARDEALATLKSLDTEIAQIQKDRDAIAAQLNQMVASLNATKQTQAQAQADLEGLRSAVNAAGSALSSAQADLANAQAAESAANDRLACAQSDLQEASSRPQVVEVVPVPVPTYSYNRVEGRIYYESDNHDRDRDHRDYDHRIGRDDHSEPRDRPRGIYYDGRQRDDHAGDRS